MAISITQGPRIRRSYVRTQDVIGFALPDLEWLVYHEVTGDASGGNVILSVIPNAQLAENYLWGVKNVIVTNDSVTNVNVQIIVLTGENLGSAGQQIQHGYIGGGNQAAPVAAFSSSVWLQGQQLTQDVFGGESVWSMTVRTNNINLAEFKFLVVGYAWDRPTVRRGARPRWPEQ